MSPKRITKKMIAWTLNRLRAVFVLGRSKWELGIWIVDHLRGRRPVIPFRELARMLRFLQSCARLASGLSAVLIVAGVLLSHTVGQHVGTPLIAAGLCNLIYAAVGEVLHRYYLGHYMAIIRRPQ
jgi:hypothetical protein